MLVCLCFFCGYFFAQTQGERLFKENNPGDAVQVLENEISNGTVSENSYNFLGLAYYQLGDYEKSVRAFQRGIDSRNGNLKILFFNQGNAYFAMKDYGMASDCYARSLGEDSGFSEALLNRANSLLMDDRLNSARDDYSLFLEKNPENPQSEKIRELISAIDEEIARREEEARLERDNWEQIDGTPEETFYDTDGVVWERFDDDFVEGDYPARDGDWERVEQENIRKLPETHGGKSARNADWEEFDGAAVIDDYTGKPAREVWESIDESEQDDLRTADDSAERRRLLDEFAASLQNAEVLDDEPGKENPL